MLRNYKALLKYERSKFANAKEVWDTFEITHEDTNQLKESKTNILA